MVGGMLAAPAEQYPAVFGNIQFFKDYPYALPTFVTGLIGLSAAIISAIFVKEVCPVRNWKIQPLILTLDFDHRAKSQQ